MKRVNKVFIFLLVSLNISLVFSQQKNSVKLQKEQQALEKSIHETKLLLSKTSSNKKISLNDLALLEKQIKTREHLLSNYDQQIRFVELQMEQKSNQINTLEEKVGQLKEQYKQLLIYVYKNKIHQNNLMFLFSAHSYYEAFKRNEYLRKVAQIQQQQKELIYQHQAKLKEEIIGLKEDKERKVKLLGQKRLEKEDFEKDKVKVQEVVNTLSQQEEQLRQEVQENERKKAALQRRIQAEIQREIAQEEAARKKREEAARKKREAELSAARKAKEEAAKKNKGNKKESKADKKEEHEVVAKEPETKTPDFTSSVDMALNNSFEANKGRLPMPVASGAVTVGFGRQHHKVLKNVDINNNGIDITTSKNAQVRAVFNGEVSSVFSMPGVGKIVIIKHGNYRTVYSNLQESFVKAGDHVTTKQPIGSLTPDSDDNVSVLHFEIHQVSGGNVLKQNPSLWIAK